MTCSGISMTISRNGTFSCVKTKKEFSDLMVNETLSNITPWFRWTEVVNQEEK